MGECKPPSGNLGALARPGAEALGTSAGSALRRGTFRPAPRSQDAQTDLRLPDPEHVQPQRACLAFLATWHHGAVRVGSGRSGCRRILNAGSLACYLPTSLITLYSLVGDTMAMNSGAAWRPQRFKRLVRTYETSMGTSEVITDAGRAYVKTMGSKEGPHRLHRNGLQLTSPSGLACLRSRWLSSPWKRAIATRFPKDIGPSPGRRSRRERLTGTPGAARRRSFRSW